ncbi:MAG: hypothetical protein IPP84_11120 [Propionivibrio sp.]|nr:hypothetical protein [Propionivibrio sp.]
MKLERRHRRPATIRQSSETFTATRTGSSQPAAEKEAQRNVELMWLTGRLMPDFKTTPISQDNGKARRVRRQPVVLARALPALVAIMAAVKAA